MIVECSFVDDDRVKSIPYPPEIGANSLNVGFIDVKAKPELIGSLHELEGLPNLKKLLMYFSEETSPFFSIGCGKWITQQFDGRYRSCGYVEFAFNYSKLAHRQNYHSMFENFGRYAKDAKIRAFSGYKWRVSPILLTAQKIEMRSCAIWIDCVDHLSNSTALNAYDKSMGLLVRYFRGLPVRHGSERPIFGLSSASQIVRD